MGRVCRSATVGGTFDVATTKVDVQEDGEGEAVDAAFLDRYAKQRWEACQRARHVVARRQDVC